MRLFELKRPSREQAYAILDRAGYDEISGGIGNYADVFHRPGDEFVLKLFSNVDEAYPAFVKFCMGYGPNPHLPRFRGKSIRVNDEYSSIRMEKLDPYHGAEVIDDMAMFVVFREHYTKNPKDDPKKNPAYMAAIDVLKLQPKLLEVLSTLTDDLIVGQGFQDDISEANVMMRGDTIVLLDPICGRKH